MKEPCGTAIERAARLGLQSYAGLLWYPVTILGETPTKYRVRFDEPVTLPKRRHQAAGTVGVVPKHAVRLREESDQDER